MLTNVKRYLCWSTSFFMKQILKIGRVVMFSTVMRMLIGMVLLFTIYIGVQQLLGDVMRSLGVRADVMLCTMHLVPSLAVIAMYVLICGVYESRSVHELSVDTMGINLVCGLCWGVLLQAVVFATIWLFGGIKVYSVNSPQVMFQSLCMAISSAVLWEVLCRGVLFRLLEEKLGTHIAVVISSLVFGLMHLHNPGSSLWISLNLALQAGLLLSLAYVYSRSLWFPIAIHMAWNFVQSGIFGVNLSGKLSSPALLNVQLLGNDWLTGGSFGPEASLQATLVCVVTSLVLYRLSVRKDRLVKAWWVRRRNGFLESESQERFL